MYRRILVGVDGSAAGRRGLDEALRLAQQVGAELRIVHVVGELALMAGVPEAAYLGELLATAKREGERVLDDARAVAARAGVQVGTELIETVRRSIGEVLAEDAQRWGADAIVVGTHGRRGLRRLVMGSDAEQVVRAATVPVLLVRAAEA